MLVVVAESYHLLMFDENTNCNINFGSQVPLNQTEHLGQKMESLALKDGYDYHASNADISTNQDGRWSTLLSRVKHLI